MTPHDALHCVFSIPHTARHAGSTDRFHNPPTDIRYRVLLRGMAASIEEITK